MQHVVIRCTGFKHGGPCSVFNYYLKDYDPDGPDGNGKATWTKSPEWAWALPSKDAALDVILSQSIKRPLNPDGTPNRPITVYSLSVEYMTTKED